MVSVMMFPFALFCAWVYGYMQNRFDNSDFWKGIILFGLNAATYKMGLARTLLDFARQGKQQVSWSELSQAYLDQYIERISRSSMPQQGNPTRRTVMERIVQELQTGKISWLLMDSGVLR